MNTECDDECTADVGLFGHMGCHKWPQCGCGKSTEELYGPDDRTDDEFWLDDWDAKLEGMLFEVELAVCLPDGLAINASQYMKLIQKHHAELRAVIVKQRAEIAHIR